MTGDGGDRAQALQVGAILLFGILVIALGVQQAVIVPNQNRHVEFNHFQQTQDQMNNLRNTLVQTGRDGTIRSASVTLGTTYPPRLIASQPPGSSGSLRSHQFTKKLSLTGAGGASMSNICGPNARTPRDITYTPSYNYLSSVSQITYENTLTYTNGTSGGQYVEGNQQIIDGKTIHLYPLVTAYNHSGSGQATINFHAGTTGENTSIPHNAILHIPTHIPNKTWQKQLKGQPVTVLSRTNGRENIKLSGSGTYDIKCTPTGAGKSPNNKPSSFGSTSSANNINPNFGNDVVFNGDTEPWSNNHSNNHTVILNMSNTDANQYQNITSIRFAFYAGNSYSNGKTTSKHPYPPANLTVHNTKTNTKTTIPYVGNYKQLHKPIVFANASVTSKPNPKATRHIPLSFKCSNSFSNPGSTYKPQKGDFFVINAAFDNGKHRTYFIGVTNKAGNNRC